VFLDAPVAGIAYQTDSLNGVTNGNGEFQYRSGETVTFRVGSVALPPVQAAPIVTPLDIAGSQDMANRVVTNILVFLQSLDQDGTPANGITIATNAVNAATQSLDFNVPVADFASNMGFTTLVTNAGGANTVPVSVDAALSHFSSTLSGQNIAVAPLANAGTAQNVVTGTTVTLNGSGSTDANGDALTYTWSLTSRPTGSTAALTGATTVNPTFVADVAGSYVFSLTVRDGSLNSTPATVTVTAAVANVAPVANAGTAQFVRPGTSVQLSGALSSDANGDQLSYSWSFVSIPINSAAVLANSTSISPVFTADISGSYVVSLTVSDGVATSTPKTVTITATTDFSRFFTVSKSSATSLINGSYSSGSQFRATITLVANESFDLRKAELMNGSVSIGSVTDETSLGGGVIDQGESVSIGFSLNRSVINNGISIRFEVFDAVTSTTFYVSALF
jgi:hypothetical protein